MQRELADGTIVDLSTEEVAEYEAEAAAAAQREIERVVIDARAARDAELLDFEWRINRYHRQVRLGITPADDLAQLDGYMQALADATTAATWADDPAGTVAAIIAGRP